MENTSQYDFNEINLIIKEYLRMNPNLSNESKERIIASFEQEEKLKTGSNILSKYSEFQVNKVPDSLNDLNKFPKLYKLYVDDEDYKSK